MLASNIHQKLELYYFICRKVSASERPYHVLHSAKLNNFQTSKYSISICSWMWAIEHGIEPCMLSFISYHLFQMFTSNMHQNGWFQVWFLKNFQERGSLSPLPRHFPRFFSSFAFGSGFALNPQALRAFDSSFALDSRALRALDSGFTLNFRLENLVWSNSNQNKSMDPSRDCVTNNN